MCRLEQAHTPEEAILKVVSTYVGTRNVDTASEVLFREAAKQALGLVRTTSLNKRAHTLATRSVLAFRISHRRQDTLDPSDPYHRVESKLRLSNFLQIRDNDIRIPMSFDGE
jgi:hypothetical protein